MANEHFYAVIMAGGSGTRLWPLSRKDRPKQTLVIDGKRSLFQGAVDRLQGLFPHERILVVTVADQVDGLHRDCPEIPMDNFILEPLPRGTASVVALAAIAIRHRDPLGVMAILTADHLMHNDAHLRQLLKAAHEFAQKGYLVTLGITPEYPATGFGYIQEGELLGEFQGLKGFRVLRFKEKPDKTTAEKMITDGNHVWNSGMFVWQVETVMAEIESQMPELYEKIIQIDHVWGTSEQPVAIEAIWPTIHPKTIDYGIMENAPRVAVIPSINLGWHDVGTWESIFNALESDPSGNIVMGGDALPLDTQGTLICEDSANRLIVTIGVENLVIIDSGNAVLVCDRSQAQRVREIVKYLEENGQSHYL